MNPRRVSDPLVRDSHVLAADDPIEEAVRRVLESDLPALPVADHSARLCGIFGEREFFAALFPGYLAELKYAGFVPRALEAALDKRAACRHEPVHKHMHTEHIEVASDFSDAQVAETFIHHRVLILPVVEDRRVLGVITRGDFFRAVAGRFLAAGLSADPSAPRPAPRSLHRAGDHSRRDLTAVLARSLASVGDLSGSLGTSSCVPRMRSRAPTGPAEESGSGERGAERRREETAR